MRSPSEYLYSNSDSNRSQKRPINILSAFRSGVSSLVDSVTSVFDEPITLTLLAVSITLSLVHLNFFEVTIEKFLSNVSLNHPSLSKFTSWLIAHEQHIVGVSILLPTVLTAAAKHRAISVAILAFVAVFGARYDIFTYISIALAHRLYTHTRSYYGKLILMFALIAVIVTIYIEEPTVSVLHTTPQPNGGTQSTSEPKPTSALPGGLNGKAASVPSYNDNGGQPSGNIARDYVNDYSRKKRAIDGKPL